MAQQPLSTYTDTLDLDTINTALNKGGVAPIQTAPQSAPNTQLPALAPASTAGGWRPGQPLVQNPQHVTQQDAANAKKQEGAGMDWGAFSSAMGDMEGPRLPEPQYNSDMNAMRAYSRAQDDKERRGNGAEHAGAILSIFGGMFGGGAMGGMGGAAGGK